MRTNVFTILPLTLALTGSFQSAQLPPPDKGTGAPVQAPRDVRAAKAGTGILRGRVVSSANQAPLNRASVTVTGTGQHSTTTDINGLFEFRGLLAGRYTLEARKTGYVALKLGQKRPSQAASPLELTEGEVRDKVEVSLPRGSVLSGVVVDPTGGPAVGVRIEALRKSYSDGRRRFVTVTQVTTNDLGEYRLYGLAAGAYYVSTTRSFFLGGDAFGLAPVYFPQTTDPSQAQPVTVGTGEERAGLNLVLPAARLARISGTALDADGKPIPTPRVMPCWGSVCQGFSTLSRPDGTFVMLDVLPGEYILGATAPGAVLNTSRAAVDVGAEDIQGLVLTPSVPNVVTGHILFDFDDKQAARFPAAGTRIAGRQVSPRVTADASREGRVNSDWSFEFRNLLGRRLFRFDGLPAGWVVKSVVLNQEDVTDTPVQFLQGQDVKDLRVTLTNRVSTVRGVVADSRRNRAPGSDVVLFAAVSERWTEGSRFIAAVRSDEQGRFTVTGLPAGEYVAVAVQALDEGQEQDPTFLSEVRHLGSPVTITEGHETQIDLTLDRKVGR